MDQHGQFEKARGMLPLSEATYLILLALTEPKHGYGIMQTVAAEGDHLTKLGPGTLYGALNNLLKQKLIERAGDSDGEQDRRKLYALTALGRATAELECARLETMARIGRRILKPTGESNGKA
ncbi:MAG TPA: PadR family transcriptional regulator [Terracidiphilus sp.]|jgi:DNA-binding PadR family transcriptional regulator|nr:PadR family transcriptional regulator [Terracidiphilus sp.]